MADGAPTAVTAFEALLDAEQQAARRADVDGLLSLQQDKKRLLAELRAAGPQAEVLDALTRRAQANIALMKHLVVCLQGVAEAGNTPAAATYGATGQRLGYGGGALRGSL